jgi:hypothetical protein
MKDRHRCGGATDALEVVRAATDAQSRTAAHERLALILTGHSIAEEAVVQPALARADEKGASTTSSNTSAAPCCITSTRKKATGSST